MYWKKSKKDINHGMKNNPMENLIKEKNFDYVNLNLNLLTFIFFFYNRYTYD